MVSYDSRDELPACLDALTRQVDVEFAILVIDNASSDGSADLVESRFPGVRVVRNPMNVGFGRANNQAFDTTRAGFYALVNPDAVPPPTAIAACADYLREHADVGLVATRLVHPDGTTQPSCHFFPTVPNMLGEALRLDRWVPGWKSAMLYQLPLHEHGRPRFVDWVQGSFLLVRSEVVAAAGGFDPHFFMYGEELEWCYRIRRAGWRVAFLPEPPVVHLGGASARRMPGRMYIEHCKGRILFFEKHRGRLDALAVRGILGLSITARWALREAQALLLRGLGRPVPDEVLQRRTVFRQALAWWLRGQPLARPAP